MPERIRFHLDENVSNAIAEGLRRRGIDVTTTPEQEVIAASDEEQIYSFSSNSSSIASKSRAP